MKPNLNSVFSTILKANAVVLTIFSLISFSSCVKDADAKRCPSCDETVTWSSYGNVKFNKTGFDGYVGNGIHLENKCDWKIYNGNAGGYGHIYQVSSCSNGVIFTWAYGRLSSLALSNGWQGSTTEGIRLGDTLDKFLNVYPGFQKTIYNPSLYYSGRVQALFSIDKKLIQLTIYNQ